MDQYIEKLNRILIDNNVCKSHGIDHAIAVLKNAINATKFISNLSNHEKKLIYIASLLHDADDYKFFKNSDEYHNLKNIMMECENSQDDIDIVIKMVDLVSASKNGDYIPDDVPEWYVIPRYADRIEAIGLIGVKRCYQYNKTINAKIYDKFTPLLQSKQEIINYINDVENKKRYINYNGKSNSMIDHFYDKLLHITYFPIKNDFFDEKCEKSREVLINFLIFFAFCMNRQNDFTYDDIELFCNLYKCD
jgi:HD superfamily phosphodiesterase